LEIAMTGEAQYQVSTRNALNHYRSSVADLPVMPDGRTTPQHPTMR